MAAESLLSRLLALCLVSEFRTFRCRLCGTLEISEQAMTDHFLTRHREEAKGARVDH